MRALHLLGAFIALSVLLSGALPLDTTVEAQGRGLQNFSCVVAVSTATTVQAVGGDCVAPGATRRLNVTDISFGTSAAAGTAADSFPTIKSGDGGTCGSNTVVIWQALTPANTTVAEHFQTPIQIPLNDELCWIMTTAGSKTVQIRGFISQ